MFRKILLITTTVLLLLMIPVSVVGATTPNGVNIQVETSLLGDPSPFVASAASVDVSSPDDHEADLQRRLEVATAAGPQDPNVTYRPMADWLENNPQLFSVFGITIGNTGSDATVLVNFGFDPYRFPTPDRTEALDINFDVFNGTDPFGFPDGFSSILALTPRPTISRPGLIKQTRQESGGVTLEVSAFIKHMALSVYDEEDIFGEGGFGFGGLGGCSISGGSVGTGCNDLPGGSGEPEALIGQDEDGFLTYQLTVDLSYTAEAVALAGGDLNAGVHPRIPFILPAFFGAIPGVEVTRFEMVGVGRGKVTDNAALAAKFDLSPGTRVWLRYVGTPDEFAFELLH